MKLSARVEKGRLVPDSPSAWAIAMRQYEGRHVVIDIDLRRDTRSLKANARYWSVLVPLAQDLLSKTRDVPLGKDQAHYVLVAAFAGCEVTELGPCPVKTSAMDSAQFGTFCDRVEAWLADNGYYLPEAAGM